MKSTKCARFTTDSKIKLSEPKSQTAIIDNKDKFEFIAIRFDGCIVCNKLACDWIVIGPNEYYLAVELKGCDVDHAVEQIEATFAYLDTTDEMPKGRAGLIVCSRYPRTDTKVQRLKLRLAKRFSASLHVKTDGRNLQFTDLFRH